MKARIVECVVGKIGLQISWKLQPKLNRVSYHIVAINRFQGCVICREIQLVVPAR